MRMSSKITVLLWIFSASAVCAAQGAGSAPAAAPGYADLLQPSLQMLHDTVMGLRFDRWKSGNVREEAGRDAGSIITDVNQTLPGLVKDADAAPRSVSAALPLARNVNALYDVALRVLDAARIAAPADQANKMQDAVNTLAGVNKDVYSLLAKTASAQEAHANDLETRVKTLTAAAAQPAQPVKAEADCPAPAAKRAVRRKKTAAKSTAPQNGTGQNGAAQKPAAGQPQKQ